MTSVITSFCPTTFEPGKTQSCLIDAMIYDFQEITLHVTEPLDWELRESSLLDTVSGWSTIIANAHAATGR